MSNVDLMREFWRTWSEEGPAALIERYDEFFTDDAEWSPPVRELTGMRYSGRHGIERYAHDIGVSVRADGKVSGVELDGPMIAIARFRDGRMELAWASYDAEAAARAQHAIVHREPVTT